jgi:hypothetical protein
MHFSPFVDVEAQGGETIDIRSDRYTVNGSSCFDERSQYNGHRLEYVCKPGLNRFQSLNCLFGEEIHVSCAKPVKVNEIGFRESGYDCGIPGYFECDDPLLNRLVQKAITTLYVCMRDNFMDCPDRERGQWIGDVSVQAPQVMLVMDERARLLVKKGVMDFFNLRQGDVLMGNVPGEHSAEVPSQNLCAISQWGLVAQYWRHTGDRSVLEAALEPSIRYLGLWETGADGLVVHREGGWGWVDHLYNIDKPVLENAWHFSALSFCREMCSILGASGRIGFLEERMASIRKGFEKRFWNGECYSSGSLVDDRANAMAVLSGLAGKNRHPEIRKILLSVFNASPYMESFVLNALCEMGFVQDACKRMMSRYHNLASNENSTLWEDFFILGTKNHAWSGAPLTIALERFLGLKTSDGGATYQAAPCEGLFKRMKGRIFTRSGLIEAEYEEGAGTTIRRLEIKKG